MTRAAPLGLLCLALAACAPAPAPHECDDCVIPPGQERAVLAMLGGREPLRGACRLETASVEGATVRASYRCPAGSVPVTLHHAAQAPPGSLPAGVFGLECADPEARASGLLDDVAARVRARGDAVRWVPVTREHDERFLAGGRAGARERGRLDPPVDTRLRHGVPAWGLLLGALALGCVAAAWRGRRG